MILINAFLVVFLIGMGFLVKRFPDLIAGYNTMSEEQKNKVDITGLSTFMRNSFIAIGVMVMLINPLFKLLGLGEHSMGMIIATILIGTFTMAIYAQTFKNKLKSEKRQHRKPIIGLSLIFGAITILTLSFLYYGSRPPAISMKNKQITISGLYGVTEQVKGIKLIDDILRIKKKTNGFNYGSVLKGKFDIETHGKCILFVQSKERPFIYLDTDSGIPIIINCKSKESTEQLAARLKENFK